MAQQFCLKWNNHTSNFLTQLMSFRSSEKLVDVTLSCEGHNIKAHRVVLSACSPYFETIFSENPCQHPIVIINGMKFAEIKAILDFMYKGEVNISHEGLSAFLKAAETLQVKGLAEVCGENKTVNDAIPQTETVPLLTQRADTPTRRRRRKRSLSDSNRSDDESVSRKMRDPSPEVHELSGDECFASDMKASENTSLNSLPQVPQNNAYTRLHQSSISDMQADASEDEYEVEPSKLLEQTLTTDSVPLNNQVLSSSESSIKIKRVTGAPDNESSSLQGPDSPPDVKPIVQFEDSATSSGALGPSDGAMMLYNDQSVSQPGPSNFQDSSILHDNPQAQGYSGYENVQGNVPFEILPFLKQRPELSIFSSKTQRPSVYRCNMCPYETSSAQHYNSHIEGHKSAKAQQCNFCGKVFKNAARLQAHMRCHETVQAHVCMYCEKKFKHPSSLKAHLKMHFGNELSCHLCDKTFGSHATLKKHMLSHSNQI